MLVLFTWLTVGASPLLFGDEVVGWFVVNEAGVVQQQFAAFGGEQAAEAALSPDNSTFALVTAGPAHSRQLLLWRVGESKATPLTETVNYYARPSFSPDGEWLYFTHSVAGPPGDHPMKMNAQVFRMRLDGSGSEKLTESSGCKLVPVVSSRDVFFLHSSCQGSAGAESISIEAQDGGFRAARPFGQAGWDALELAVTRDGRRVAVVASRPPGAVVYEYPSLGNGRAKELARFETFPTPMLPQWSASGDALFVKVGREVWKLPRSGKPTRLLTLEQPSREALHHSP